MAIPNRYLIRFSAFICLLLPLFQITAGATTASTANTFHLVSAVNRQDLDNLLYDLNGKQIKVIARSNVPSEGFTLPPNGILKLYREVQVMDTQTNPPTPKTVKQPMAEIPILSTKPPVLIVLTMNPPGSKFPLSGIFTNYSRDKVPLNSTQFINMSRYKVAIRSGTTDFILEPAMQKVVPYEIKERGDLLMIKIGSSPDGNQWKVLEDGRKMLSLNVREVAIFCDDENASGQSTSARPIMFTDYSKPPEDQSAP